MKQSMTAEREISKTRSAVQLESIIFPLTARAQPTKE
jgi:hypothetical protein